MKLIYSPFVTGLGVSGILATACLPFTIMAQGSFGLAGDTIRGKLAVPGSLHLGNYFTQNDDGYPTSNVPSYAAVGSGIEFGYYPKLEATIKWRLTVDVSDNQIAINETLSDSNPGYWNGSFGGFVLTLSDLDWAGAAGIASVDYVSHNSQIGVNGFDAHSIQFGIGIIEVYPTGPYSITRTTIVQLTAVPEPSAAVLIMCGSATVLWRKSRRAVPNRTLGIRILTR